MFWGDGLDADLGFVASIYQKIIQFLLNGYDDLIFVFVLVADCELFEVGEDPADVVMELGEGGSFLALHHPCLPIQDDLEQHNYYTLGMPLVTQEREISY